MSQTTWGSVVSQLLVQITGTLLMLSWCFWCCASSDRVCGGRCGGRCVVAVWLLCGCCVGVVGEVCEWNAATITCPA
jgi:hypothetical protein